NLLQADSVSLPNCRGTHAHHNVVCQTIWPGMGTYWVGLESLTYEHELSSSAAALGRPRRGFLGHGEFHLVAVVVQAQELQKLRRYRGAGAGDRHLFGALLLQADDFLALAVQEILGG